jgi:hypothetical protein
MSARPHGRTYGIYALSCGSNTCRRWKKASECRPAASAVFAAGERREREHRVGAHRDQRRLGIGDQRLGALLVPAKALERRVGELPHRAPPRLAGLVGEADGLRCRRQPDAHRAGVHCGPRHRHLRLRERSEPPLLPQARDRPDEQRRREVERADRDRRRAEQPQHTRVVARRDGVPSDRAERLRTTALGVGERKHRDPPGVVDGQR